MHRAFRDDGARTSPEGGLLAAVVGLRQDVRPVAATAGRSPPRSLCVYCECTYGCGPKRYGATASLRRNAVLSSSGCSASRMRSSVEPASGLPATAWPSALTRIDPVDGHGPLMHDSSWCSSECGKHFDGVVSRVVSEPAEHRPVLVLPSICPHQTRSRCQRTGVTDMLEARVRAGQKVVRLLPPSTGTLVVVPEQHLSACL